MEGCLGVLVIFRSYAASCSMLPILFFSEKNRASAYMLLSSFFGTRMLDKIMTGYDVGKDTTIFCN